MSEDEERAAVVAQARAWIGTPWVHMADMRGVGVDCGMLLIRCFKDSGVAPEIEDPRPYCEGWYLHRDDDRYLRFLTAYASIVAGPEEGRTPKPGDIVAYRIGRTYGHAAIVTGWPWIVHAFRPEGMVTITSALQQCALNERPHKFLSRWG